MYKSSLPQALRLERRMWYGFLLSRSIFVLGIYHLAGVVLQPGMLCSYRLGDYQMVPGLRGRHHMNYLGRMVCMFQQESGEYLPEGWQQTRYLHSGKFAFVGLVRMFHRHFLCMGERFHELLAEHKRIDHLDLWRRIHPMSPAVFHH